MSAPAAIPSSARAVWLKRLHQWHWISSALCLLGILLFAVTGITLNHAALIESKPVVTRIKKAVPPAVAAQISAIAGAHADAKAPLPPQTAAWAADTFDIEVAGREAEWSDGEAYLPLARPGGDAWLRISGTGDGAEYELTTRGAVSWLNDLHKGRNTGPAWSLFIDLLGVACLVFCITGFFIMKLHAANRPSTWPVIGFGILLPVLLALLFIH